MPTQTRRKVFDYFEHYTGTGNAYALWSGAATAGYIDIMGGLLGQAQHARLFPSLSSFNISTWNSSYTI